MDRISLYNVQHPAITRHAIHAGDSSPSSQWSRRPEMGRFMRPIADSSPCGDFETSLVLCAGACSAFICATDCHLHFLRFDFSISAGANETRRSTFHAEEVQPLRCIEVQPHFLPVQALPSIASGLSVPTVAAEMEWPKSKSLEFPVIPGHDWVSLIPVVFVLDRASR